MADAQQMMVTEHEQRAAVAALREAAATGELAADDAARREAAVWRAVTPRDLWRATGGRAGSPERADKREWRRAVVVMVAVVLFAAGIMWAVLVALQNLDEGGGGIGIPNR